MLVKWNIDPRYRVADIVFAVSSDTQETGWDADCCMHFADREPVQAPQLKENQAGVSS